MKIMVIGGGGREHAIIKKIKENKPTRLRAQKNRCTIEAIYL